MAVPTSFVLLAALVLVGLIGWFDYVTSWEVDATLLYALPIVLVAWKADRRLGFAFALLCTVTWWVAQLGSHPYQTRWGFALALVSVGSYFAVLAIAVAR